MQMLALQGVMMKALKVLIVSNCPQFLQTAAQSVERAFDSASVLSGPADRTLEFMCRHQPSLIVIDAASAGEDSIRLTNMIWSIEPNIRILLLFANTQRELAVQLQRSMPADAAGGFILNTHHSDEKMRMAMQGLHMFGNSYVEQFLQKPDECCTTAVA
jgi:DNA-binding NarL/FixJ family response regulator